MVGIQSLNFWKIFPVIYLQKNVLQIVLLSDTIFLSFVSSDEIAGVGVAVSIVYTLVAMIGSLGSATTGLMGKFLGAKDETSAHGLLFISILIGISFGLVLALIQIMISFYVPQMMGFSLEAEQACRDYLVYMSPMLVMDGIFIVALSSINVYGKNNWTLYASSVLAITNIGLNSLVYFGLVPGFELSAKAIAISTVVSQIPALIVMWICIRKVLGIRFDNLANLLSNSKLLLRQILRIILPSMINPVVANVTQLAIARYLISYGTDFFAAFIYCRNLLIPITTATVMAYSNTIQIFVSYYEGAGDSNYAKHFLNKKVLYIIPFVFMSIGITWFYFLEIVTALGSDQKLVEAGALLIFALMFVETIKSVSVVVDPTLRGLGDVKFPVYVFSLSQLFIVIVGYFIVYVQGLEIEYFLCLLFFAEFSLSAALWSRWNSSKWASKTEL